MNLPDHLREICDHKTANWPKNWFENFGSKAFFHLVGLREFIYKHYGPESPTKVAGKLIQHKEEVAALIKPKWLFDIYGTAPQDLDIETCLDKDNFNNLTAANIRNSYTGTPVTFPAALLSFLAASVFLDRQENEGYAHKRFQIRFSGHYIAGFGEIFPQLNPTQKAELASHTQQTTTSDYKCFYQMADGKPVTKPFADRTAEFLKGKTDKDGHPIPQLEVKRYELRTDISGQKKPASSERTYFQFRDVE